MIASVKDDVIALAELGRDDPAEFMIRALDVKREFMWDKMRVLCDSMRDHERTTVPAGHGVSKTFTLARLALTFVASHCPSTVVTTAPTGKQVKDLLWREIREAHENAKIAIGGKLTTTMLDMQQDTGRKWFATGFSTRPDTVTQEATAFQGYHNKSLLIIFDEAAGIMPEIWRAAEHIGAPYKRFVAIGNPASGAGDFAESLRDLTYNQINIAVTDTPNFKAGKIIIPGLYGREYEERIRTKYGIDSDEYRVRVLGEVSRKAAIGSYHGAIIDWLYKNGRIGDVPYNPDYLVHTMTDPGYTSAWWLFQVMPTGYVHILRYWEDTGRDMAYYADLLRQWSTDYGYRYGKHFAPIDIDNNQYKIVAADGLKEIARQAGINFTTCPFERSTELGRNRATRFLRSCRFNEESCIIGIEKVKAFHETLNKAMSTEGNPVFTGVPDKDGNDHAADGIRYISMIINKLDSNSEVTRESWRATKARMMG